MKMLSYDLYRARYSAPNGTVANVVLSDLDRNFQTFQLALLTGKGWKKANITIAVRLEVTCSPSNGALAKLVYHDLDLHFQDHEI